MKMKKVIAAGLVAAAVMGTSSIAYAGVYYNYDLVVPVSGGIDTSPGYKADASAPYAYNDNELVGGGYKLYSTIRLHGTDVSDEDYFTANGWSKMKYYGDASSVRGYSLTMHIKSGLTCWVQVHSAGSWTPDAY
ncbi:hypothetical protein [Clostridium sp. C8-1-8]|uniref:hypothetical protein n=1 Tax=Clostridium sp. C8-1-8 TaxID=2698831 RepID=UPI00136FE14B|nr:hypothetical protein [Clostridium sp. C8-1-8]